MTDKILPNDPQMKKGDPGMFLISSQDAIELGPKAVSEFVQRLKNDAENLELEVKIEPLKGGLMFWWYPKEFVEKKEPTFLDDVLQHMSAVPEGELQAEKKLLFADEVQNLEELAEFFKPVMGAKSQITVTEHIDKAYVTIKWGPNAKVADDTTAPPA